MSENLRLGPAARQTYNDLTCGLYPTPTESLIDPGENLANTRPEMYAIGAVICADVIDQLKHKQIADEHPFGLTTRQGVPIEKIDHVTEILKLMKGTCRFFIEELYEPPKQYKPAFERLGALTSAAYKMYPEQGGGIYSSPYNFIIGGMNTGITTSLGAHLGIKSLLETSEQDEINKELFSRIASNSSRKLAFPLAMDNLNNLQSYQRVLLAKVHYKDTDKVPDEPFIFNPNLLELVGDMHDPKAYVDFIRNPHDFIDPRANRKIKDLDLPVKTLTCPASVKLPGQEVAIKTIWDWTTNIYADYRYGNKD